MNLVDRGPNFNFTPYDYGPFDAAVYSEAESLKLTGDVVVAPSGSGRWNTYAASGFGLTRGQQILAALQPNIRNYIDEISGWVRSRSFRDLVISIYDAYHEMRINSVFRG